MHVSRALGGVTILQKGAEDIICTNTGEANKEAAHLNQISEGESTEERVVVDVPGGLKRCGGQGDILSGAVGTMMAWGKCFETGGFGSVALGFCSHLTHSDNCVLVTDQFLPHAYRCLRR